MKEYLEKYWNNDQQRLYIKRLTDNPDFFIGDLNLALYPATFEEWAKFIFITPKSLELREKGHNLFSKFFNPYKIELTVKGEPLILAGQAMSASQRLYINRYFKTPFFITSGSMFYVHDSKHSDALLELIMFNGRLDDWANLKSEQEKTSLKIIKESMSKI